MVFLPGLTADHSLFEKQTEAFHDKYRIIVWDCPCHGKSRPYAEFSYAHVTAEPDRILRAEGVDQAVFIGQSLGGMIAQYYIDLHPEKAAGFISVDSVPFGDYYSKSDLFWLNQLAWMCRLFPDKLLRSSMARMCGVSERARGRMPEILSVYSKKELCHLMYIGEAAFIPENKSMTIPCRTFYFWATGTLWAKSLPITADGPKEQAFRFISSGTRRITPMMTLRNRSTA